MWQLQLQLAPIAIVGRDKTEQIDLISLQKRDPEIKRFVAKGEHQGWKIWEHDTGLVLATKMERKHAYVGCPN